MKNTELGPFLGENNRLPDTKLVTKDGAFVRSAVNADVTGAGTFQRRQGSVNVVGGSDCHSLWGNDTVAYFIDYNSLFMLTGDPAAPDKTLVSAALAPDSQMSYAEVNNEVYCSNSVALYRLTGATIESAVIDLPTHSPQLAVGADGALSAGIYKVSVSHVAVDGAESGALPPTEVVLADNDALIISDIPVRAGFTTNVWVSDVNGDILYLVANGVGNTLTLSVPGYTGNPECRTLLMLPMPPGHIVRYLNGRLLVAVGNVLFYSEPYNLGLMNPVKNYVQFSKAITMVEPCQNGFYISADQTYWVPGDVANTEMLPVLPYKAVLGTSSQVPNENSVWWMSERGMVVGTQDGQVKNMQEATVAVNPAQAGASLFREQDGMKQMVASLFSPQQTVMAASSYMDAEVIRKETVL